MTEKKSPIISFKNFSFQYRAQKKPTLKEINLDIYPGERVLIAGPSGCGKSTLAGCINGLNPFSNPGECSGELIVDGGDAPKSSIFQLSAHVGTVLQDPDGQFIGLTVGEDIAFALENSCMPQDEMHEITRHAAELVGIQDHLDYAPHELSGGQKQRVSLAGVMVDQVKILLFDEPLANLDLASQRSTVHILAKLNRELGMTIQVVAHDLNMLLPILTGAVYLLDGHPHFAKLNEVLDSKLLTHLYGTQVQVVTTPQGDMFVTPNADNIGCNDHPDMHSSSDVAQFHHHEDVRMDDDHAHIDRKGNGQ